MSIIRVFHNHENPFVQLNKGALWDSRLSLRAVGLWARCLSRPDDWQFSVKELTKSFGIGRNTLYKIINELIETGYVIRVDGCYSKKEDGKFNRGFSNYVFLEFSVDDVEKEELMQKFKKCFGRPSFGDTRSGDAPTDTLLIKRSKETENTNINPPNPQGGVPNFSENPQKKTHKAPCSRRKKVDSEWRERAPRVSTRDDQHESLLKKVNGDEKLLNRAYEIVSDWKIKKGIEGGSGDYSCVINWGLKGARNSPVNKEEARKNAVAEDREIAEKVEKNLSGHYSVQLPYGTTKVERSFSVGNKYMEVLGVPEGVLNFGDPVFKPRLASLLRKMMVHESQIRQIGLS